MRMVVEKARLIGKEEKTSKRGNSYKVLLFAVGTDTLNIMYRDCNMRYADIKELADYKVILDYTRYGFNLLGLEVL